MINLKGVYECKIDPKGRIMVPIPFRKQLSEVINDGFILKRSVFGKCLELYPIKEWERETEIINKLNRFVEKNVNFIRVYMAGHKPVEIDPSGKLLITKDLLTFAEIKKDVVIASAVYKLEIWAKELYEQAISMRPEDFRKLAEEVGGSLGNYQ